MNKKELKIKIADLLKGENEIEKIIVFGIVFLIMMVVPGHIVNYKVRKKHV